MIPHGYKETDMIFSSLKDWKKEQHLYNDAFQKAFQFLEAQDLKDMHTGEYEIDGRDIYAIVMERETDEVINRAPETHVKYIDIQLVIKGVEVIGYSRNRQMLTVKTDALLEKDLMLYEGNVPYESFVTLTEGDFAIFFPEDVHRPLCAYKAPSRVKKIVIKIAV